MTFESLELDPAERAVLDRETLPERVTLPEVLRRGVASWTDEELIVHDGVPSTWRQVDARSATLAKGLLALGVTKGSRVGVLMPNSADWLVAFMAAARIGAVVSPISTFLQGPELHRTLELADVQVLLSVDRYLGHDYVARLEQIPGLAATPGPALLLPDVPFLRHVVLWGDTDVPWALGEDDLVAHGRSIEDGLLRAVEDAVAPADWFLTVWTSGTTSDPKGVVHTHGGVFRYCHALRAKGRADVHRGERSYSAMPFFWLGGLNGQIIPSLLCGAVTVTTSDIRPDLVAKALVEQGVGRVTAWMRPLVDLRQAATDLGIDVSGIRGLAPLVGADGNRVPEGLAGKAFGMTETFGPVCAEAPSAVLPPEKAGSMGRPVGDYECQIVDPVNGDPVPTGTIGELRVRGSSLMVGYYKRERSEVVDPDGFLRTGDRCSFDDDGFLYWHGRGGDVIKTSGANVSPLEIEQVLRELDVVADAVVFGIPDEIRNEAIVAAVIPAAGAELDVHELRERLRQQISGYKVPHHFVVVTAADIPRTESGKPKKHVLREALFPGMGDAPAAV